MRRKVGLWIDHKKAVLFTISDEGANLKRISSNVEKDVPLSGSTHETSAQDYGDKRFAKQLDTYYAEVMAYVRDAVSILIFGPGDAKVEFRKRLENQEFQGKIVGFETVNLMTDNQIVTKVRERFLK
jgi:hypothetical protein